MFTIEQPNLNIPSKEDPLYWARFAHVKHEWLKVVVPQLGLDAEKILLADVLWAIVGDDANKFMFYIPHLAKKEHGTLLFRLCWEIKSGVLPTHIALLLRNVYDKIQKDDWSKQEGWEKSKIVWLEMKATVQAEMGINRKLRQAHNYYQSHRSLVNKNYANFLRFHGVDDMF